jgi:hypothetical protein
MDPVIEIRTAGPTKRLAYFGVSFDALAGFLHLPTNVKIVGVNTDPRYREQIMVQVEGGGFRPTAPGDAISPVAPQYSLIDGRPQFVSWGN